MGKEIEIEKRVSVIAEAVTGLKYHEWSRIKIAIDKKFSSESAKVELGNAEELKQAILTEF